MLTKTAVYSSWTILLCVSISFRSDAETIEAKQGTTVHLPCLAPVDNGNKLKIQWKKTDAEEIIKPRKRSKYMLDNQGNLKISKLTAEDAGMYICAVGNDESNVISLVIQYSPIITNLTENFEIEENNYAVMTCLSEGYPTPLVTWQIAEQNIFSLNFDDWSWLGNGSTINVTMPCSHCKVSIKCIAENHLGYQLKTLIVSVLGKPKVSVVNKVINRKIGDSMTLRCKIKSLPKFLMNWKRYGVEVSDIPTVQKRMKIDFVAQSETHITFILTIKNLKKKDFGPYECIAYNKYGNSTEEVTLQLKKGSKGRRKPHVSPFSESTDRIILSNTRHQNDKTEMEHRVTVSLATTTLPSGLKYSVNISNRQSTSHLITLFLLILISLNSQLNLFFL